MKSILNQLFNGTLDPAAKIISNDPEYNLLLTKMENEHTYLAGKLSPEDLLHLEQLEDLSREANCLDIYTGFAYGFRLGMGLLWEVLQDDT